MNFSTDQPTANRRTKDRGSVWDPQRARRVLAVCFRAFSISVVLAGLGFLGWACVQWLQTARWQPLTVNGALASWPATREWAAHPRTWLGLHRVVMWVHTVPVFLLTTVVGGALVFLSPPVTPRRDDRWW